MKKVILNSFFLASLIMAFQVEAKVGQDKKSWAPIVGQDKKSWAPTTGQRKDSYSPRSSKSSNKKSMRKKTKKEDVKKVDEDIAQSRWFNFDMD